MDRIRRVVLDAQERLNNTLCNICELYIAKAQVAIAEKLKEQDEFLCCDTIGYVAVEISWVDFQDGGSVEVGEVWFLEDFESPEDVANDTQDVSTYPYVGGQFCGTLTEKLAEYGFSVFYDAEKDIILPFVKI